LKTNGPISFGFTGNPRSAESKALGKKREARYTMAPYGLWCVYIYYCGGFLKWGTPISSMFKGFSIINHPFRGTPIVGNPHIEL